MLTISGLISEQQYVPPHRKNVLSQSMSDDDRKKIVRELDKRGDEFSMEIANSICERSII